MTADLFPGNYRVQLLLPDPLAHDTGCLQQYEPGFYQSGLYRIPIINEIVFQQFNKRFYGEPVSTAGFLYWHMYFFKRKKV